MPKTLHRSSIDLPGVEDHRFSLSESKHDPQHGGIGKVTLERKVLGSLWVEIDSRIIKGFTKMDRSRQAALTARAEAELLEEWFSLEIARALD